MSYNFILDGKYYEVIRFCLLVDNTEIRLGRWLSNFQVSTFLSFIGSRLELLLLGLLP